MGFNFSDLLRAVHMAGKDKNNFFTPVQKLSQVAPAGKNSREESIEDHVAFGFKSSLIRLIANMVYKKRKNQDLVKYHFNYKYFLIVLTTIICV